MTDKEYREQKLRVRRFWDKWHDAIGMGWWRINLTWDRARDEESPNQLAVTSSSWQYRTGHVTFNLPECAAVDDETLEETVVHELCHILLAPIHDGRDDQAREITEFAVTSTARAIIWAREAGHKDKQKDKQYGQKKDGVAVGTAATS